MTYPIHLARWTEAELDYLRETFPTDKPINEIAEALGRSFCAVNGKARTLDLYRPKYCGPKLTRERRQFIVDHYHALGPHAIAARFGVTPDHVVKVAGNLGVRRISNRYHPAEITSAIVRARATKSQRAVAAEHGMTVGQIAGILHRARRGVYAGVHAP